MIKRLKLFNNKKEFFSFFLLCTAILSYSLLIEYNNYKNITRFDTTLVDATVIKQYKKTKLSKTGKIKEYQVLKLKSNRGVSFYTSVNKKFPNHLGKNLHLEINSNDITFYKYLTYFYAFSKVLHIDDTQNLKLQLNTFISNTHKDYNITQVYKALYTATSMDSNLQNIFSNLGISHLFAISGFHLGVLAAVLFFLFKLPYKFLQQRYFPYRSYKVDSFIFISLVLLSYLLFLDTPPSLLRAFSMLLIGFILYDRGYEIISMNTLLITVILLLSFFPTLLFSLGFWLSVSGVFYIFLFIIHFKELNKIWQFILLPIWVYLMMLPFSLYIFGNFSIYHPLSILWTTLFSIFYPLSILMHLIAQGDIFDTILLKLISIGLTDNTVLISLYLLSLHLVLSFASIFKQITLYILIFNSLSIFIYTIYKVT